VNDQDEVRNRQRALYGAPLRDCVHTLTDRLALSQAALARVLGISAPMLSQLVTAQRTKIGNPVAVERLHSLLELADRVDAGLDADQVARRIEEVAADDSTTMTRRRESETDTAVPEALHRLLHALASGRELSEAADALADSHPGVAELLRVYGTGPAEERAAHYAALARVI